MSTPPAPASFRVGLHVHLYLYFAVLVLNVAALVACAMMFFDKANPIAMLVEIGVLIVLTNLVLWYSRRQCSASDLTGWQGLLIMTAYMSIGVGSYSVLVAVPAAIVAIVASIFLAILGLIRGERDFAPRNFRRLLHFYYRHRMYQ